MVTYNNAIPKATDFPSNSQSQLLANFAYLVPGTPNSTGLSKDHNMLLTNSAGDGMHLQTTFATNQTTPGFTSGVSVLYANTANTASQLFYNNGAGNVQLTAIKASVPTLATSGCTFLPGGLLLQWGTTGLLANGAVTMFPVPFSVAPYNVQISATGSAASGSIYVSGQVAASWTFGVFPTSGNSQVQWTAIGLA